jgi:peptidoglycan/LPS O-acetylase OafA/YrhL
MTLSSAIILMTPFLLLFAILGFITLNRYITYKERVALAQLGYTPESLVREGGAERRGNRGVLWGGVITAMSGLALLLGLATLGTGAWLIGGLLPLCVGLGMVVIYFMTMGPAGEARLHARPPEAAAPDGAGDGVARIASASDSTPPDA